MTSVGLVKAISALVRDAVMNYRLQSEEMREKRVTVYEQIIPEEVFDADCQGAYHPLIGVALQSTEDDERAVLTVGLTFAIYSEDADGWMDLLNLQDTVRLRLMQNQLLERQYRLIAPLTAEVVERQPLPFFYGIMTARYMTYQPQEERKYR